MLFNSINYFIFLTIVFILNYIIPFKFRWILLLISSIIFYTIGGLSTIAVPIVIVISTFVFGILLEHAKNKLKKKTFFLSGIIINVGLLSFFKYINFKKIYHIEI